MIILTEVAAKLQEILNGTDNTIQINDEKVQFSVATQGFRLDSIADENTGKNFIPVFLSLSGGQYNAIPNMKQASYVHTIQIYYPIQHKDVFYTLTEFLADKFVGKLINFGTVSGKALCNISVPRYSEIQDLDISEFREWVQNTYAKAVDVMGPWMSMEFQLFATSIGDEFIFGNNVKFELTIDFPAHNGREAKTITEQLIWTQSGTGGSVSPIAQQRVDVDKFAKNVANITNFNKSFNAFIRYNEFWERVLEYYNEQDLSALENIKLTKTYTFGAIEKVFEFNQITLSINENIALGEPLTVTIATGDKEDEETIEVE